MTHYRWATTTVVAIATLLLICTCARPNQEHQPQGYDDVVADQAESEYSLPTDENSAAPTPADYVSSSAAAIGKADSSRLLVRTAELRFGAKDLIKASYAIEDIVAKYGGFVAHTTIQSQTDYTRTVPVSTDSSLVLTYYTLANSMRLRVPAARLDATLKEIALWIDHLDDRQVTCTDIGLTMLGNTLASRRAAKQQARLARAIDAQGRKLDQIVDAEQALANQQEQADNALLSNLQIKDQVAFATVSIAIYQAQAVSKVMKANEQHLVAYQPSFGTRLLAALQTGASGVAAVTLWLAQLWPLVLLAGAIVWAYRRYRGKK